MKARHVVKGAVKMIIEADGNFVTLIIRASKREIFKVLDHLIPDETPAVK